MDGTITALDATVGAVCSGTVATIQDVDNLTVEVTIPASSVGRLKTGLQCNITSDATDDTITGTLTRIDPVANDSGSFGATVTVNGQDSGLLVGIPAKVEIVISTKDNVFTVPRDAEGHLTDEGLYAIKDGTLDDLGALEAAEHLSFCDYCMLRYTAMIDAAPDCMKQPMRDLIPQVQSLMRLRSFRIMTNRYVSAAAAVVLGFVMWGAVSTFGVANPAALLPQQPAARQERFGTKFNTAVNGFYKSLDDTFKSFTLTAENGLDQIRAQSIGGSTAKGE